MRRLLTEALSYCHLAMDRNQIIAAALGWTDTQLDTPSPPR
jgi:hypothetical protein